MAASKFSTYDSETARIRDVDPIVSNIDPTDTPFQSAIGSETTKSKLIEWTEDVLDAPADNAQLEGFDAPAANHTEVTFRTNLIQTLAKSIKVTGIAEEQEHYTYKSKVAKERAKKGKEIKRDLERQLVGIAARAAVVGNDATARLFANPAQLVDASMVAANGGTPRALTEALVLTGMQAMYNVGADFTTLMIKPGDALVVGDFAKATGRARDVEDKKKIVNAVDVYEGPFGDVKVKKNRWQLSSTAWLVDPDMWALVWFRKWRMKKLPETGDYLWEMLFGDVTVKHKNFKGSYLIKDLS